MGIIFFIPLVLIASIESTFDKRKHTWMETWFRGNDEGVEDTPEYRDPTVDDPQCIGLQISKVPFSELIQVFPNTSVVCLLFFWLEINQWLYFQSSESTILSEIDEVKEQLKNLTQKLNRLQQTAGGTGSTH